MEPRSKMDSKTFLSKPCPGGKWKVGGVSDHDLTPLQVCSFCGEGPAHANHLERELGALVEMTLNEYQQLAMRTSKPLVSGEQLLHASMGLANEVGEIFELVKAERFYGKPLDNTKLLEELGDLMWFAQLLATSRGVSLSEVCKANLAKLRKRYPEQYTDALALARLDKAEG